jgi:hypothetical protein
LPIVCYYQIIIRSSFEDLPAPSFDPVPVRRRRDGWTAERQHQFIAALARSLCVDQAVAAVGMSRESVYRLRRHPQAASFAAAWNAIMTRKPRMPTAPSLLWHRAFYGTLKPIVRGGQIVATLHRLDNKAAMSLLHRMDQADRARARMRARRERAEVHGERNPDSKETL